MRTKVAASQFSPFWYYLEQQGTPGCTIQDKLADDGSCAGTMIDYATYYFGGKFSAANRGIDIGVLVGWILLALFGTWFCLKKLNYTNT